MCHNPLFFWSSLMHSTMSSSQPLTDTTAPAIPPKSGNGTTVQGTRQADERQTRSSDSMQERQSRRQTLRLDTQVTGPVTPASVRFPSMEATDVSPESSSSSHSRQDSSASYTPLRSARGSLSLGVSATQPMNIRSLMCLQGTAHHSVLSRRSSLSQSGAGREAWALPLAGTTALIVVPDAVAARSPLCAQTTAQDAGGTAETRTLQEQAETQLRPRRRIRSTRDRELRNTAVLVRILCVLLVTAFSMCKYSRSRSGM